MDLEESARKRARTSGGATGSSAGGDPDRLSALPDCLLHVIMSSLKAQQVVQTSVLSRRWSHLWRSAPCLDVDVDEFKDWEEFEDFASLLMIRCSMAQLESFRLHVGWGKKPSFGDWQQGRRQAGGWLRRAMKYKHCSPDPPSSSLCEGWSSSSWQLKSLYLCNVTLDSCFANHVSSACRSLQDLELESCVCNIQAITSCSLKNLVLKNCRWHRLSEIASPTLKSLVIDGGHNTYLLVISAPAVACLHLTVGDGSFHGGISINDMPSLVKASIHQQHGAGSLFKSKFKLLHSVSNVTSLELSGVGTKVLGKDHTLREFNNLRNSLLERCYLSDCTLRLFLRSSPNIEKLTLWHCKFSSKSKEDNGTPELKKSLSFECNDLDFLCQNLKIEIIYKEGDARELALLHFIGKLSNNIKCTKVNYSNS